MRRYSCGLLVAALLVSASSLLLTGCSSKKSGSDDGDGDRPRTKRRVTKGGGNGGVTAAARTPVKGVASYDGVIKGKVTWKGDNDLIAKARNALDMKTDTAYCREGKIGGEVKVPPQEVEVDQQTYRVGQNGGLGNVFVWIQPESQNDYFEVPEDQVKRAPKEVIIHQPHCAFFPHCVVTFPVYFKGGKSVETGQKFSVENDALIAHTAKYTGGDVNGSDNPAIPAGTKKVLNFQPEPAPISMTCGTHGWMSAYVRALEHPYGAVTSVGANLQKKIFEDPKSSKFGTFEITGVPVGVKVKLYIWHESSNVVLDPATGKDITLTPDKKVLEQDFVATTK